MDRFLLENREKFGNLKEINQLKEEIGGI